MGPQPGYGRVYRRNASTSPFVGVVWSALLLQQLEFGPGFDQPFAGVAWPASLQRLAVVRVKIEPAHRRSSVTGFHTAAFIQCPFQSPCRRSRFAASLQQLSFGPRFNRPIVGTE